MTTITYTLRGRDITVTPNTPTPRRDAAKALRALQRQWRNAIVTTTQEAQ